MWVRCPKHGVVYDDFMMCPRCQKEATGGAAEPPKRKLPTLRIVLALLAVAGVSAGVYFWRQHAREQAARAAARERAERAAAVAAARVPPGAEVELIRRARRAASSLDRILRADRGAILGFAEGPVDTAAADRGASRRAKQYAAFVRRMEQQLVGAAGEGPATWGAKSEEVQAVANYLAAAIGGLRHAAPPGHVPPRADRRRDLDASRGYLEAAHTALGSLPR